MKSFYRISALVLLLSLFVGARIAQAQYTTTTVNGVIGSNEYGTHTNGNNQQTNGQISYMTWDATNLYVGISGATVGEAIILYLDKDPQVPVNGGTNSNGTNVGVAYDGTNFAALPFRADLVVYAKNGYREYQTANGSNGWSGTTGANAWGSYFDNGQFSGTGVQEFAFPWASIGGIPASFNFFLYKTSSGGSVYSTEPSANATGSIGTSARYERYYTVTSTTNGSATKPFSRDCYVFNTTGSQNSFGAIAVWDFTMNSSGLQIARSNSAGGAWTIGGTLRVNAGSVYMGGTGGSSYGTNTIANIVVSGGLLDNDYNPNALTVSGNVAVSTGTLALSNTSPGDLSIAGNYSKTSGTLTPRSRAIIFAATAAGAQSYTSDVVETNLYVVNNNTAGIVTLNTGINNTAATFSLNTNSKTVFGGTSQTYTQTLNSGTFTLGTGAQCTINSGNTLTIGGTTNVISFGSATTSLMTVNGTLQRTVTGTLTNVNATTLVVGVNGTYDHKMDGGVVPTATWTSGSPGATCLVSDWGATTATPIGAGTQSFYNFTWSSGGQTAAPINLALSASATIAGTLLVTSTGTGSLALLQEVSLTTSVANFDIQAGTVYMLYAAAAGSYNSIINTSGSYTQSTIGAPTVYMGFGTAGTRRTSLTLNISGSFTESSGLFTMMNRQATTAPSSSSLTLTGASSAFAVSGGTFTMANINATATSAPAISMSGNTATFTISGTGVFNGVQASAAVPTITLSGTSAQFNLSGGTFTGTNSTGTLSITLGGASASFNVGGGTHVFTSSSGITALALNGATSIFSQTSGSLDFGSSTGTSTVTLKGGFSISGGTLVTSTAANTVITFNGGAGQTISYSGTPILRYTDFTINSGSTVTLSTDFQLTSSTGFASTFTNSGTLTCGTKVISDGGGLYGYFVNNGTLNIGSSDGVTDYLASDAALGNIQVTGGRTYNPSSTYVYNGSSPQNTGSALATIGSPYGNVTIANTSGVTLNKISTVGSVSFTAGLFKLSSFDLTVTGTFTGAGAGKYIQTNGTGGLKQSVPNTATSVAYPVGNSAYDPITLKLAGTGTTDSYTIICLDGAAPALANNPPAINRYWSIKEATATGTTGLSVSATYNGAGERINSYTTASPVIGLWSGAAWTTISTGVTDASNIVATSSSTFTNADLTQSIGAQYIAIGNAAAFASGSYSWNGNFSTDWGLNTNWTPSGIPGINDNITAFAVGKPLVIISNRSINNLAIGSGTITVSSGVTLTIGGTASGSPASLTLTGSTIVYLTQATIPALSYYNLVTPGATARTWVTGTSIAGDLDAGAGTWTRNGTQILNGTGNQIITSTGSLSFGTLSVTNTGGTITVNCPLRITVQLSFPSTNTGIPRFDMGTNVLNINSSTVDCQKGIFKIGAALTINAATSMTFGANGTYEHNMDGGTLPLSTTYGGTLASVTWIAGSTCAIVYDAMTTLPTGILQPFQNFTWDSPNQPGIVSFGLSGATAFSVAGTFKLANSGTTPTSTYIRLGLNASYTLSVANWNITGGAMDFVDATNATSTYTATINTSGNYNQSGGVVYMTYSSNQTTRISIATVTVGGNVDISGGKLALSLSVPAAGPVNTSLTLTGASAALNVKGTGQLVLTETASSPTVTLSGANANFNVATTTNTLAVILTSGSGAPSINLTGANSSYTHSQGTVDFAFSPATTSGVLNLKGTYYQSGGTIYESSTSAANGTINFNGTTQTIKQDLGTVHYWVDVNITSGSTTSLISDFQISTTVSGSGLTNFTVASGGTLNCSTYKVYNGAANLGKFTNSGTLGIGDPNGITSGTTTSGNIQTTGGRVFNTTASYTYNAATTPQATGNGLPATAATLTIANTASSGIVNLGQACTATTITLTSGLLATGNNVLTNASGGTISTGGATNYVQTNGSGGAGGLKRNLANSASAYYPVGNSSFDPITLTNGALGIADNPTVIVNDAAPSTINDPTAVLNRTWTITESSAGASRLQVAASYNSTDPAGANFANTPNGVGNFVGYNTGSGWTTAAATYSTGPLTYTTAANAFITPNTAGATYTLALSRFAGLNPAAYTWAGTTSNAWGTYTNWSPSGIPTGGDDIIISSTGTNQLSIADNRAANNVTISGTGNFTATSAGSLTIGGTVTHTSTSTSVLDPASTVYLNSASSQNIPSINFGNLNLSGAGGRVWPSDTVRISGTLTTGGGGNTFNGYTEFNGTGAQTINALNYNNLIVSNNRGLATITLPAGTIGVSGAFSTTSLANYAISNGSNTVNFNGANGQTIPPFSYYNISSSNNTRILGNGTIQVAGNYTPTTAAITVGTSKVQFTGIAGQNIPATSYYDLDGGTSDRTLVSTGSINVAGTYTPTSGVTTVGTSTFNYNGSGAQTITAANYYNLTVSNSRSGAALALGNGTIDVANDFDVSTLASYTTTGTSNTFNYSGVAGKVIQPFLYNSLTSANVARTLSSTGTIGIRGSYTPSSGVNTIAGSTVDFNGTGAQAITATNYNNLNISNSRSNAALTLGTGTIDVAGTFGPTVTNYSTTGTNTFNYSGAAGQVIQPFKYNTLTSSNLARTLSSTGVIQVSGNYSPPSSAAVTLGTSTIDYNGTGAQNITATNYYNLTISNSRGNAALTLNTGTIDVAGTFSPTVTNYSTTGTNTFNYSGAGGQVIQPFLYNSLSSADLARTLSSSGTISISGSYTPPATASNVTVGTSVIDFVSGGAQTVPASKYYTITNSGNGTRSLSSGGTIDIAGIYTPTTNTIAVNTSTVLFSGSGAQTIPASYYYNLSGGTGGRTLPNGTIDIAGAYAPTSGSISLGSNNTVNFSSGSSQTIPASFYNNLSNGGAGDRVLANGTIDIAGAYSPTAGTITVGTSLVLFSSTGSQTIPASFYYDIANSTGGRTLGNGVIDILGSYSPPSGAITLGATNTINFSSTSVGTPQPFPASTYKNVTNTGNGTRAWGTVINIDGSFTPSTGVNYNSLNTSTNFTASSGTITIPVVPNTTADYVQLQVTGSGTFQIPTGTTLKANNGLVKSGSGAFNIGNGSSPTSLIVTGGITHSAGTINVAAGSSTGSLSAGNYTLSGGTLNLINSASATGATVTTSGLFSMTGTGTVNLEPVSSSSGDGILNANGGVSFANSAGGTMLDFGSGASVSNNAVNVNGNFAKSGLATFATTSTSATKGFVFGGGGSYGFSYSGNNSPSTSYTVSSGTTVTMSTGLNLSGGQTPRSTLTVNGTLDVGANTINASNTTDPQFTIGSGGTLITAHANGLSGAFTGFGLYTFHPAANYVFSSAIASQTSNHAGFGVTTANSLTISNTFGTVSLDQPFSVTNLTVNPSGSLNLGTSNTVTVSGTSANNGTILGSATGKVVLTGSAMTGNGTYAKLDINNASGVSLSGLPTISGTLNFIAGKISTGSADTLYLGSSASMTETTTAYASGNLKTTRTVGTNFESFGSMGVILTAGSDLGIVRATRITGSAISGASPCCTGYSGIKRYWIISPSIQPATANRQLQLSWPSSEDNGLFAGNMQVWKSPTFAGLYQKVSYPQDVSATNPRVIYYNNIPSFSSFTVSDGSHPLPLGLLRFSAARDNQGALVTWTLTNEKNWATMVVERSATGKSFDPIGSVSPSQNGRSSNAYRLLDRSFVNSSYYRLKLISSTGEVEYSEVKFVKANALVAHAVTIFPNPSALGAQLAIDGFTDLVDPVSLEIVGLDGRVTQSHAGTLTDVNQALEDSISSLPSGVYYFRIGLSDGTQAIKFIKQ